MVKCVTFLICFLISLTGCVISQKPYVTWIDDSIVIQPTGPYAESWQPPLPNKEEVHFVSADGTKLHGWYCPVENPKAVILFAHGNAGNLEDRWIVAKELNEACHASVMLFDYRGYGKSEGHPTEAGVLADARAARSWLAARAAIPEGNIVLMGRSLGGGVMVDLAANDGAKALILESTFTSLPDVANGVLPYTGVGWIMRNRLNSIKKIGRYHGPVLIAHGTEDHTIPYSHGEKLFATANEPKEFVSLPGLDHNWERSPEYLQKLSKFLDSMELQQVPLNIQVQDSF